MNNCCAGEIHLAISRKRVVLFTAEFKTVTQSAGRFHELQRKSPVKELDQS